MARPHLLGIRHGLCVITVALAPLASSAWAQPQEPKISDALAEQPEVSREADRLDDDTLKSLVDDLNAQDLQTRDRAQLTLSTSDGVELDRIEEYLDSAPLSPEQLLRLSAVGLSLFVSAPRPAMGVEFGTRFGAIASVTINNTVPGFDAANTLVAGDIILRMDGIPVQDFNHARQIILSFDPFDQISISVLRSGEPIDAVVRFGSFGQLPNPSPPTAEVLRQAWNIRRARRAPDRAEPIVVALDPSLRPNDPVLAPQVAQQAWRAVEQWIARRFEGGGELYDSRLGAFGQDDRDAGPNMQAAGAQRAIDMTATEPFNNRPVTAQIAGEIRLLDAEIARLIREQGEARRQLTDPNLRVDIRNRLNNRIRALDAEIVTLRKQRRKYLGD